jgi:predicted RNase H-like nuclease (RuvC/YqgF family)
MNELAEAIDVLGDAVADLRDSIKAEREEHSALVEAKNGRIQFLEAELMEHKGEIARLERELDLVDAKKDAA